jgi:S1-C subfamily serine protease
VDKAPPDPAADVTTTTLTVNAHLLAEAQQFSYRVRNVSCDATGSSFATSDGIVTNRHVASGATTLQLSTWNGADFNATVQAISEEPGPDLSVLEGQTTQQPAVLSTSNAPAGTKVWAAGYPLGSALTLTPGIVVDYISGSTYGEPGQIMELTNAVEPGNSGSPLLNAQGEVVGVVFALNSVTGNGLAIPASTLQRYLATPGDDMAGDCIG